MGKLTDAVRKSVCEAIACGNYVDVACEYAGISLSSYKRWMRQGATGREPQAAFYRAVKAALPAAEVALVREWHDIALGSRDWKAIATLLERRYPERWARSERIIPQIQTNDANESRDKLFSQLARFITAEPAEIVSRLPDGEAASDAPILVAVLGKDLAAGA